MKLTARTIKKLAPAEGQSAYEVPDDLLKGLVLRVHSSGALTWCVRYRPQGSRQQRRMTLGRYPTLTVARARDKAATVLRSVDDGKDPQADARALKAGDVPDACLALMARFVAMHCQPRNRTWREQARTLGLRYSDEENFTVIEGSAAQLWATRGIASIEGREIANFIDAAFAERGAASANQLHAYLNKFFNWAVGRKVLPHSPMIGMVKPGAIVKIERVLTHDELALVWHASGRLGQPFTAFVRTLILTGARRREVANMRANEVQHGMWTLPAKRSKNKRTHELPLSDLTLETLAALPVTSDRPDRPLFSTTGLAPISNFSRIKVALDREIAALNGGKAMAHWTFHDLRRTASTNMHALGLDPLTVEKVLNHTLQGVAAVYNKHDYTMEKRRALQEWSDAVSVLVSLFEPR